MWHCPPTLSIPSAARRSCLQRLGPRLGSWCSRGTWTEAYAGGLALPPQN